MNQQVYEKTTESIPWVNKGMVTQSGKRFGYRYSHDYSQLGIYDMSVFEDEEL